MNYEKLLDENHNCNGCVAIAILLDEGESHVCPQCKREHVKLSAVKVEPEKNN